MIRQCYISFMFLCLSLLSAQVPDTLWTRTYGCALDDRGMSVQVTSDGGFIIGGYTFIAGGGGFNFYLLKTDENGDTVWSGLYGGSSADFASSVQQTSDGGYVLAGYSYSFGGLRPDVYIIKTDSLGIVQWDKVYGGAEDDAGCDITQTHDGGYIITGYTSSFGTGLEDLWLLKTDPSGDTIWAKTYGTMFIDGGAAVLQTVDSGYVITGYNGSGAVSSLWILKTDSNGDMVWSKIYSPGNHSGGTSIHETIDGGFIVAGTTFAGAGESDFWLLKIDSQGDTLWTRTYGGPYADDALSVKQTCEGGYIVVGRTWSFGAGLEELYIVRTDSVGDVLWAETFGGTYDDRAQSVDLTPDRGYVIVGNTESFGAGDHDIWLLRIEPDPHGIEEYEHDHNVVTYFKVSPNPFRHHADIRWQITDEGNKVGDRGVEIRVYDTGGRLVRDFVESFVIGYQSSVQWHGLDDSNRRVPSGVYFVKLEAGHCRATGKVLLIR